jgi:hypothetical protein
MPPTVMSPKPPCSRRGGRPSSSKWSLATQYESASTRPAADRIPESRNVAADVPSFTGLKWVGVTPHSVHRMRAPARPYRSSVGRTSSGGLP